MTEKFEGMRVAIGAFNRVTSLDDLKAQREAINSNQPAAIELERLDGTS